MILLLFQKNSVTGMGCLFFQIGFYIIQKICCLIHFMNGRWRNFLCNIRKDMVTDLISRISILRICVVYTIGKIFFLQEFLDLFPGDTKQGTDDPLPYRLYRAQPGQPGSPDQMKKHGLRTVICIVGNGDPCFPCLPLFPGFLFQDPFKAFIAHVPACFLCGNALFLCQSGNLDMNRKKRKLPLLTQGSDILLIPGSLLPDPVVYMHHQNTEGHFFLQFL